jgi:hypothetical protein
MVVLNGQRNFERRLRDEHPISEEKTVRFRFSQGDTTSAVDIARAFDRLMEEARLASRTSTFRSRRPRTSAFRHNYGGSMGLHSILADADQQPLDGPELTATELRARTQQSLGDQGSRYEEVVRSFLEDG